MAKPSLEKPILEKTPEQELQTNLEAYKKNIQEIKTSVEQVKQQKDAIEKDKTTIAKEVVDQKQKEIDDKKKEIESKKTETLALMTKIKNDKLANLDKKVPQDVADDEKYLNDLDVNKAVTKKNFLSEQWDAVTSKEEWKDHTRNNVGRVAVGIGAAALVYKGISWLFGGHKKDKSENKESDKKEEKPSWWKKALTWAGIGTGGLLLWKNWDKVKDFFSNLFGKKDPKDPEKTNNLPSDYENLSPEIKEKYISASNEIDSFTQQNMDLSTVVSFPENDKDSKANILFGLDKQSKNLQEFYTNNTLDYISGETTDGPIDTIMNRGKEKMYNILLPFLSGLESFKPFGAEFVSNPASALDKWLKSGTKEERVKTLSLFYRQYMNVINYSVEKKKLLEEKLAKASVMGKDRINQAPSEKEQDAIDDLLDDDKRKKTTVETFFKTHKLMDLPALTKEYGIGTAEISADTKELLDSLQKERDEILQKDAEGETVFSRAETDLKNGVLPENSKKELDRTCEHLLDIEFGDNSKSLFGAYTHLLTDIFSGNKELGEDFMNKTKIKEVADEFKGALEGYRAKIKAGTFSAQDLQSLKTQTDTYLNAKKNYEISMKNIEYLSGGLTINWGKILSLPLDAARDIGKAFGAGKTNSRWERIGYGLGGAYVVGQTLYIGSKLIPSSTLLAKGIKVVTWGVGRTGIEIGKLPVTLVEKGLKLATGRTHLTGYGRSNYLKNATHLEKLEKLDLLKYAYLNGEISEKRLLSLSRQLGMDSASGGRITSVNEVFAKRGLSDPAQIELFKQYRDNKSMRSLLIKKDPITDLRKWDNIKYSIKDKALKYTTGFDVSNLTKLQKIHTNIEKLTVAGSKERVFRETFMHNTKTLDKIDDLMKNKKMMGLLSEISTTSNDYAKLSKILANDFHTFESLADFEKYMLFLKNSKAKITDINMFTKNTIGNRSKIKTMDAIAQSKYIETGKLNTSFLGRRIESMKSLFKKSAETIRKVIKKSPYPQQVAELADGVEQLSHVDEETVIAMQSSQEFGNAEWMMTMSKDKQLIQELSPLFKDKEFVKALGEAKTSEAIKDVFTRFSKESLFSRLSPEFTEALSKTGNTRKIVDTMTYVKKYEELGKIGKILQNPTMKYASRIFGRVVGLVAVGLGAFSAYSKFNEAAEIAKTNTERADIKKTDAQFEIGYAVIGGIDALGAFGALAGVETVCAFVPGVGWVIGGVIIGVSSFVKDVVFDTLDKYNKNYKDFVNEGPLLIKQHILTTILGNDKTDVAFGDWLVGTFKNLDQLTKKTSGEAMKGLLYAEEYKRNSLAMYDISNAEQMAHLASMKPPISRADVAKAIDDVEQRVAKRYAYLKAKCGTYREGKSEFIDVKKIVPSSLIAQGRGLWALDQLVQESGYAVDNPETFDSPQKLALKKQQLKERLDKNPSLYTTLQASWTQDPKMLVYMYRYANDFKSHVEQFGTQDPQQQQILQNIEYFKDYMLFNSLTTGLDIAGLSQGFDAPNFIRSKEFFLSYKLSKPLASVDLYGNSTKVQTVLYRIATEVIGREIPVNTMDELKSVFSEANEKTYGLYFKGGDINRLCVNGNYGSDNEYPGKDIETLKKIRADITEQIRDNDLLKIGTGTTILNKEIGAKYLAIIDQELKRV